MLPITRMDTVHLSQIRYNTNLIQSVIASILTKLDVSYYIKIKDTKFELVADGHNVFIHEDFCLLLLSVIKYYTNKDKFSLIGHDYSDDIITFLNNADNYLT